MMVQRLTAPGSMSGLPPGARPAQLTRLGVLAALLLAGLLFAALHYWPHG
jgi:hypothetical protein